MERDAEWFIVASAAVRRNLLCLEVTELLTPREGAIYNLHSDPQSKLYIHVSATVQNVPEPDIAPNVVARADLRAINSSSFQSPVT